MRTSIFLTAAVVTLTACGNRDRREFDSAAGAVGSALNTSAVGLACSPAELRSNQAFTLKMPPNHGSTLTAMSPEGTEYLVVFYGAGKPGRVGHQSLVPPDTFSRVTEMNVDPKLLTVAPSTGGPDTNVVLFQKPGTYRFQLAADPEADGPSVAECVVRYTP